VELFKDLGRSLRTAVDTTVDLAAGTVDIVVDTATAISEIPGDIIDGYTEEQVEEPTEPSIFPTTK